VRRREASATMGSAPAAGALELMTADTLTQASGRARYVRSGYPS
jgi:hypothetical protein